MNASALDAVDRTMMTRCIALSRQAAADGEYPFACVIAKGAEVVVETTNRVARETVVMGGGKRTECLWLSPNTQKALYSIT